MAGAPVALLITMLVWASQETTTGLSDPGPVWMCFNLAVLASAVMLICRWFLLGEPGSAWAAAALLCMGVYLQPLLAPPSSSWSTPLSVVDLLAIVAIVAMVRAGVRRVPAMGWRQPLMVGIGGGLALAGIRDLWEWFGPTVPVWATFTLIAAAFPVAAGVCANAAPHTLRSIPRTKARVFIALNLFGVFCYHLLPHAALSPPAATMTVALSVGIGSALLVVLSSQLLHDAFRIHARRLVALTDRAASAETAAHQGEEMLHEFRATVAGIDSATRLLLQSSIHLPPEHRDSLQRMLEAELTRLQAMMQSDAARAAAEIEVVELDQLLEPLVVAQRSQGATIEVAPTGLTATCSALELAKAVHIVLCNARQHAPGATVTITPEADHETVTLHIRDDGPGIAPDVRSTLFTRRGKAKDSSGEGLGLFSARQAIRQQGGELVLEHSSSGTSFAMVLPR
ncbi:HAMP domain-containing histidine kinase [Nocardioides panacisoli]|uniref:sensor histidine kinase n=1 Tax=Nocardioides panacisoli TaxID=627624 RepID=UPI001C62E811|nr:HAMP domain-containing sensor histidine kinase [Nocardioides panacisoli]QYJ04208.1 HAMP domain-containing histidine kinase [Nocardioides panacisoli]